MSLNNLPREDRIAILQWRSREREGRRLRRSPLFTEKVKPEYKKVNLTRTLYANNEFISGTAIYERKDNVWRFVSSSEELKFLRSIPFDLTKVELLKRGLDYHWG